MTAMTLRERTATTGHALDDELAAAGLTGRGGAAFPTHVKLSAALRHGARLIVNACDGEYGAAKDAYVVASHLDELRDGIDVLAAAGIGDADGRAPGTLIAARRESGTARRIAAAVDLPLLTVPDRYVASEASALVALAGGGPARPLDRRRRPDQGAYDHAGRRLPPTLVLNAETVLRIGQIAAFGADWFRSFGTDAEPGPRLVAVSGAVSAPGVVDTEAGVRVAELIEACDGTAGDAPVLVGGLNGIWLPPAAAAAIRWDGTDLARFGGTLGAGVVHVLAPATCPLAFASALLDEAARHSAGQCGPCLFGLPAIAADVRDLLAGADAAAAWERLDRRLRELPGRGACSFPDGVAGFARSTLRVFADEVAVHASGRRCPHDHGPR